MAPVLAQRFDVYSHYNLACTYALFAEHYMVQIDDQNYIEQALVHLRRSLYLAKHICKVRGLEQEVAERARKDCSLQMLRNEQNIDKFEKVIGDCKKSDDAKVGCDTWVI